MNMYALEIGIILAWVLITGFCVQLDISKHKDWSLILFCFVFAPLLFAYKLGCLIAWKLEK